MKRLPIIWHLYPALLFVTFVAVLAVSWYVTNTLSLFYIAQIEKNLTTQATLIKYQISSKLSEQNALKIDALSKMIGTETETRITIILPNGQVLADSDEDPTRMDNHARRPEVSEALRGRKGVSSRYSRTLQQNHMYVALPIKVDEEITGCIRVSIPVTAIEAALSAEHGRIAGASFLIALALAFLSLLFAQRISKPLQEMRLGAESFAEGELKRRLPIQGTEEIAALARALNKMAEQLDERFQTVNQQRNELEAVLSSMIEGVIAVDNNEKIIRINQAAAELLEADPEQTVGRSVQEVLRKAELQKFITDSLQATETIEHELMMIRRNNKVELQAHGSPLFNAQNKRIGALIVLNDITRLRHLENLRRDFVANVSHELKTPITAIKGWAETLQSGDENLSKEQQEPIGIIVRQADRLNAIINDLLNLSRIEQGQEQSKIDFQTTKLSSIIESAIQSCSVEIMQKEIEVVTLCPEDLTLQANPPLLEQALVNLLNNAIKYSEKKNRVVVEATARQSELCLKVQDFGCGIPQQHLSRLFERFYRVDAARSREMGGTGLGLAIVKHIVQAHHGRVDVHSVLDEGSSFSMILPLRVT
ncbi:MAG: ATP-binding protein [Desulfuromonadaceae bacterium]